MRQEKIQMYSVFIQFLGVTLGFIGIFVGAYILNSHQKNMYKMERSDRRIEKKEQLLADAYSVYARMPEIQFWQTEVNVTAPITALAENWIYELDKERNPIIAKQFANLLRINKMIEIYFGEESRKLVRKTFNPDNHQEKWWSIPNEELNAITESMAKEINRDVTLRD